MWQGGLAKPRHGVTQGPKFANWGSSFCVLMSTQRFLVLLAKQREIATISEGSDATKKLTE
jgi:hypothetical protein